MFFDKGIHIIVFNHEAHQLDGASPASSSAESYSPSVRHIRHMLQPIIDQGFLVGQLVDLLVNVSRWLANRSTCCNKAMLAKGSRLLGNSDPFIPLSFLPTVFTPIVCTLIVLILTLPSNPRPLVLIPPFIVTLSLSLSFSSTSFLSLSFSSPLSSSVSSVL